MFNITYMKNNIINLLIAGLIISGCSRSPHESLGGNQPEVFSKKDSLMKESFERSDTTSNNLNIANHINLNTKTPSDKKFIKTADLKFKVNSVLYSTMKIEGFTVKYGGYLVYSNLQNRNDNERSSRICRDSILFSKQIVVENNIQIRIPNDSLDKFTLELNPLVLFFDYRTITLSDVTLQFSANKRKYDRLKKYEKRQAQHIDSKTGKLNESTDAEENLLSHQNQEDDIDLQTMNLEDQIKYCNISINIYQKPIIVKEVIADFEQISHGKPEFF